MRRKNFTIFLVNLAKLQKVPQAQVRPTTVQVLDLAKNRASQVIGPLVAALEISSDLSRKRICDTLGQLTTQKNSYNPNAREAEKNSILQGGKKWWLQQKGQ